MNASQQLELSRWAATLEESGSDERRAAGHAIRLLTEANLALEHAHGNGGGPVEPVDRRELERRADRLADAEAAELRAAARAIRTLCAAHERLERAGGRVPKVGARVRRPSRRAFMVLGALVLVAGGIAFAARAAAPDLHADGPDDGAVLDGDALASLSLSSRNVDADWSLDGKPVQPQQEGDQVVFTPGRLPDGPHEVVLRIHRLLGSDEKNSASSSTRPRRRSPWMVLRWSAAARRCAWRERSSRARPCSPVRQSCPLPATAASSCVSRSRHAASCSPPPTPRETGAAGACR